MHYLVDGHNLIAKMATISLADPDDEVALVKRLKRWSAGSRKRWVTVIFDGGLPGGEARQLSGGRVKVFFASTDRPADDLIIRRIQQAHNPAEFTVVSGDREVLAAAEARRMPYLLSEEFAGQLEGEERRPAASPAPAEPALNAEEVEGWLALFGPEPALPPEPPPERKTRPVLSKPEAAGVSPAEPPSVEPAILKADGRKLTAQEVEEWLRLFGASDKSE
ncbi:MAG: NYN domain-containing protein [Chloroflexi bacterium]|nr:NYN domain-containing protein [Chloroflexota bacterium]MCI0575236.1 NYN domain-containing protein [Chloroflexota bacterium]MCI0648843.1 NYN domain-containing protein [Chloroflexota bacterium]MCI0726598.1 NYN domain-containing protein [Chloroflexota bacterium]